MPPVRDKIQAEQLSSVASSFLKLRPRLLAVAGVPLTLVLVLAAVPRMQLVCLLANFGTMLTFFFLEARRQRRSPVTQAEFGRSLVLTVLGIATLAGFSGGVQSPFIPVLFAPVGISFAAFGGDPETRRVLVALLAGGVYIVVSTRLFSWAPIPEPHASVVFVMATTLSIVLLYFGVTRLAAAYRRTGEKLEQMRVDVVRAAARRTAELGAMGGKLAHDLKNPLSSIKGLVRLNHDAAVVDSEEAERAKRRSSVVLEEVSRLERVLGEYLSFSRPIADVEPRNARLDELLVGLADLLEGEAAAAGLVVRVHVHPCQALFDEEALRRALLNLAQNGLTAMRPGGTLTITNRRDGDLVHIAIRDDGAGMAAEDLARIKEPFFSARPGGTGLGVVIADRIVQQHAGTLEFESELGCGTTATVTLPARQPE